MNLVHRERFLKWESEPQQFLYIKQQFLLILKALLQTAIKMCEVVAGCLKNHPETKSD
jgi:hypothetical protein